MSLLIVASDSPGAGKTSATLALAHILDESGRETSAFKPFSSVEDDPDQAVFAQLANPGPRRLAHPYRRDRPHPQRHWGRGPYPVHGGGRRQPGHSRGTRRDRRVWSVGTGRRLEREGAAGRRLPARFARVEPVCVAGRCWRQACGRTGQRAHPLSRNGGRKTTWSRPWQRTESRSWASSRRTGSCCPSLWRRFGAG